VCNDVDADGLVTLGMVLVCAFVEDMFELCGVFVWEFADGGEDMFCVHVEGGEMGSQINENVVPEWRQGRRCERDLCETRLFACLILSN
jgi:hypothetical protein